MVKTSELLNCIECIKSERFEYTAIQKTEDKIIINGYKAPDLGYESCEFKTFKNCEIQGGVYYGRSSMDMALF